MREASAKQIEHYLINTVKCNFVYVEVEGITLTEIKIKVSVCLSVSVCLGEVAKRVQHLDKTSFKSVHLKLLELYYQLKWIFHW